MNVRPAPGARRRRRGQTWRALVDAVGRLTGQAQTADQLLMERVAAGERAAQKALLTRIWRRVRNMARHFGPDATEAEDFAQEALYQILKAAKHFRGDGRLESFCDAICVRCMLRRARRLRARWRMDDLSDHEPLSAHDATERAALTTMRAQIARRLLGQLDERERMALLLKVAYGYRVQEVAQHMEVSEAKVRYLLQRARLNLHRLSAAHPELLAAAEEERP